MKVYIRKKNKIKHVIENISDFTLDLGEHFAFIFFNVNLESDFCYKLKNLMIFSDFSL